MLRQIPVIVALLAAPCYGAGYNSSLHFLRAPYPAPDAHLQTVEEVHPPASVVPEVLVPDLLTKDDAPLIWIDCEFTGLPHDVSPDRSQLGGTGGHQMLEIALIVTKNDLTQVARSRSIIIHHDDDKLQKMSVFSKISFGWDEKRFDHDDAVLLANHPKNVADAGAALSYTWAEVSSYLLKSPNAAVAAWREENGNPEANFANPKDAIRNYWARMRLPTAWELLGTTGHTVETTPGLLADMSRRSETSLEQAEAELIQLLSAHVKKGAGLMAGNMIGMDRRFVDKYMPKLAEFLGYRLWDVSTIKEMMRTWWSQEVEKFDKGDKPHRALDDIEKSIEEMQYYKKWLTVRAFPTEVAAAPEAGACS